MRRLSDRARLEGMLALRKALDGVRHGSSAAPTPGEEVVRSLRAEPPGVDESTWWRRAESSRDGEIRDGVERNVAPLEIETPIEVAAVAPPVEDDLEVAKALDRIADSIERIAAQLDSYHAERAEHLDAIEFLLREMVISTVPPTAARSVALGGVVDPRDLDPDQGITIIPDGYPLEVDTAVEVRSRFHDRWISGFSIAEAVDSPGRCRYRLTRRSDGIPLPILFEACDVRAVLASYERPHAPSRPF